MLTGLLAFIVACFPLIIFHELGHLIVGYFLKAEPTEFSIGFGKTPLKIKIKNILFKLGYLPLGGYVKFGKGQFSFETESTGKISAWKWIFIALAGPVANLVLTGTILFSLYFLTFSTIRYGENQQLYVSKPSVVTSGVFGLVGPGPIYKYDATTGNYVTYISTTSVWYGESSATVITKSLHGISFTMGAMMRETTQALGRAIIKKDYRSLSGPVGIASVVKEAYAGTKTVKDTYKTNFFYILAAISFALGYFNLLPLVFLDGGRALLAVIEMISKKEINLQLMDILTKISLLFFVFLVFLGLLSDLMRLYIK